MGTYSDKGSRIVELSKLAGSIILLAYLFVWLPGLGISWLLNKGMDNSQTEAIFNAFYYAGYPVYGIVLGFIYVVFGIITGVVYLFALTFPYSGYALAFSPIPILLWWFLHKAGQNSKKSKAEEDREARRALRKSAPEDVLAVKPGDPDPK